MASTPQGFGSKSAAASNRLAARRSRRGVVLGTVLLLVTGLGAVIAGVSLYARRPAAEVTGTVNSCPARLGPQTRDQCVSTCLSCDHGTVVTCTTACRLKGEN